ncbi:MAG: hypothetical protein VB089_06730 [Anaerolineaceae bacterium]|jgi:hypothetical protein|nr:hypothetical protein [Anaerolineaceae bacterium]
MEPVYSEFNWKRLYPLGGTAALLQLAIVLVITVAAVALGLRPANVQEYYALYQSDRLALLLRDDFTSLLLVALYLFTIPALYIALRRIDAAATALASLFVLVAVVTCFATNSGFSMLYLSQQYAAAPRRELLAAGEAVLAADMWHSSGAYLAGILMQGGGMILSLVMLRSRDFAKATAYSGLLGNGLDLIQHVLYPFAPAVSDAIAPLMGVFYLAWFPLLAWNLFRLGRSRADRKEAKHGA